MEHGVAYKLRIEGTIPNDRYLFFSLHHIGNNFAYSMEAKSTDSGFDITIEMRSAVEFNRKEILEILENEGMEKAKIVNNPS